MAVPYDLTLAQALIDGSENPELSTHRILGVRLRKFALWHRMILKTIGSPFVTQGRATMRDVRIFVGVCNLAYGCSRIRKPWLVPALLYCRVFLKALFRKTRPEANPLQQELVRLAAQIAEYAGEYLQEPDCSIVPPDRKPNQAPRTRRTPPPEEIRHIADLIEWTKYPLKILWELPIGHANWLRVFALEAKGNDIDFNNEEERAFQASLPPEYNINRNN